MARISDIPVSKVAEVVAGARAGQGKRRECVRVTVELEEGIGADLAGALRQALVPETSSGLVHVGLVRAGERLRVNPDADVAIVACAGEGGPGPAMARAFSSAGVPCALLVETAVEAPGQDELGEVAVVAAATPEALVAKLADWMAGACERDIALAANFPFVRRSVAMRCVRERGAQNAAVGLLPFGSGADMPVMAANQALMALDVAGAYGDGVTGELLCELGLMIAGAFVSRGVARAACRALPGLGLIVRPAVAYGGTAAMGMGLVARRELAASASLPWKTLHIPGISR